MKKQELILVKGNNTCELERRLNDDWEIVKISSGGISTLLNCLHYCYVLIEKTK